MNPITLLITDDHKILREDWKITLDTDPSFHVLATCATGAEAIITVEHLCPQLVIMDINLPDMSGIAATAILTEQAPGTKVLGYALHNEPSYARRILAAGALGYVTKTASIAEMKTALLAIFNQQRYVCGELQTKTEPFSPTVKRADGLTKPNEKDFYFDCRRSPADPANLELSAEYTS